MFKPEDIIYPHEAPKHIPSEPHFQRVWSLYRRFALVRAIEGAVQNGSVTQEDADKVSGMLGGRNADLFINKYVMANLNLIDRTPFVKSYDAAERVFQAIGYEQKFSQLTA
jgi:hypothetical protein